MSENTGLVCPNCGASASVPLGMTCDDHHPALSTWDPIPDRAIKIDGYSVLPERLIEIDNEYYVRCHLHGLIRADHHCGRSCFDHHCIEAAHPNHVEGGEHEDQAVSHDEWADIQSEKLTAIARLHSKQVDSGGGTDGGCAECGLPWPCRTVHYANGWGDPHPCEDAGWCSHAGVPVVKWW